MLLAAALCLALAAPSAPITAESVAQVVDPVFARCSPESVPGASVAVVYDGKVVFTKGYGLADPEKNIAVDPEKHLFRAASVSKLITATAVMQLVEQGKADLHADVNSYLGRSIVPETFGPVSLLNLLQHSAGFDDEFLGMAREKAEGLPSLASYLETGLPKRVFPPGHFASYSNHGVALAGLVVEAISGQPFAQYAQEHIFTPLGMVHSYFDLVPDADTPLAVGHWRGLFGGPLQRAGYDYPCTAPASTLCATAPDMARFMLAHLGGGGGILRPESIAAMHKRYQVPGLAIGFFERWENGRRCLAHTGLIWGYASQLLIYPDEKFGVYITLNAEDGGPYDQATGALMDAFFPETAPRETYRLPAEPLGEAERVLFDKATRLFAGTYRHTRYPRNSFLKFGLLVSGRVSEFEIAPGARPGAWRQQRLGQKGVTTLYGMDTYQAGKAGAREDEILLSPGPRAILLGATGIPLNVLNSSIEPAAFFVNRSHTYERIHPWESTHFLMHVAAGCYVVLLSWPLARPLGAWRRRLCADPGVALPRWLRCAALAHIGALVLFVVGIGGVLATLNPFAVAYGPPPMLLPLLCLPLLGIAASVVMFAGLARAWRRGEGSRVERAHLALTAMAGALLLAVLNYWNLVGFHLG